MNIYPKTFFSANPPVTAGTCFVLMPFAENFREVYDVIKEAIESDELRLRCKRADDFLKPHILETILENITRAEYVIADLTGQNANVFYELGLAHCVKDMNKIVLITQDMQYVPFDLRQYRCIVYEQSIRGARRLYQDLINTLQDNIGEQFTLTLNDNEKVTLPERLSGDGRYLYELSFEAPAIGRNASKLQIHFKKYSVEGTIEELPKQYLYLDIQDTPCEKIENIPWQVRLVKAMDRKATFSLQQIR